MQCLLGFLMLLAAYNKFAVGDPNLKTVPVSLTSCEGTDKLIHLEFKTNGNGKQAWNGNATVPITVDSNADFIWEMRWWKDGAWEEKPKTFKGKPCFYLESFVGKAWKDMREGAIPPIKNACPIPAGTYRFENVIADYSNVHLPMMKKGRWQGKITINKDGKVLCLVLIVDMV